MLLKFVFLPFINLPSRICQVRILHGISINITIAVIIIPLRVCFVKGNASFFVHI